MTERGGQDFIRAMVTRDTAAGKWGGRVATRFPPEPNGYLHIGHAKSLCLNFGVAQEFRGTCNLRFDDTNPLTEDQRYVDAIKEDVRWMGFEWAGEYYASDYFERLYDFAVILIEKGQAYVDSQTEEEIRVGRGSLTRPGVESPYRARSIAQNRDLFARMRAGEFPDGAHVLRAKIDMQHPNFLMRDPLLYRIRHASHYRRGDAWCLYPLYDFTHCLSDAIERITHSLCTLEFKDNRELYDWIVHEVGIPEPPEQTEFARLNVDYTVLSKRKLVRLVREGHVRGWDDPRMPTIAGLRRRGVTPEAIRAFADMVGVARVESRVDMEKLEHAIRDDLNPRVPRVLCVLRPLKVVIENWPEGEVDQLDAPYYPHDVPKEGSRSLPFSRVLYIERDDFMEQPSKGFFRLAPGREVRLRYAYLITCTGVVKDASGEIVELRCAYDPATRGGNTPDGRKVKGTIHWVSAGHALTAEVRLYDRLFTRPNPDDVGDDEDFTASLNPDSLVVLPDARIEPSLALDPPGTRYQFERQGYFVSDLDSKPGALVYTRTVQLRDTWAKVVAKGG
jgi:glutaminyl-tRNA synthetase